MGGICLNVGCIPSKALLDSSEHYYNAVHHFEDHGITTGKVKADFTKMSDRKGQVVKKMNEGINYLMKKNKIDVKNGFTLALRRLRPSYWCISVFDRSETFATSTVFQIFHKKSLKPKVPA